MNLMVKTTSIASCH